MQSEIERLIMQTTEKNDDIRFAAVQRLSELSEQSDEVSKHWEELLTRMSSENSYQRSIGAKLIAVNIRWLTEEQVRKILPVYLNQCDDEAFVTARQTIQSLTVWIESQPQLHQQIRSALLQINTDKRKDSQSPLLKKDIAAILKLIDKQVI